MSYVRILALELTCLSNPNVNRTEKFRIQIQIFFRWPAVCKISESVLIWIWLWLREAFFHSCGLCSSLGIYTRKNLEVPLMNWWTGDDEVPGWIQVNPPNDNPTHWSCWWANSLRIKIPPKADSGLQQSAKLHFRASEGGEKWSDSKTGKVIDGHNAAISSKFSPPKRNNNPRNSYTSKNIISLNGQAMRATTRCIWYLPLMVTP